MDNKASSVMVPPGFQLELYDNEKGVDAEGNAEEPVIVVGGMRANTSEG